MVLIAGYFKNNKRKLMILLMILTVFIGVLILVRNDYYLYTETIVNVINVTETEIGGDTAAEPSYTQEIEAKIMNGKNKGKIIKFENVRSYSGLFDFNIRKGNDVFVDLNDNLTLSTVNGFKRDFWAALELCVFCFALMLVAGKKSRPIFLSTFINIIIFALIIFLNTLSLNIFILFIIGTVLFTVITLFIIGGYRRKAFAAVMSTLLSVLIMMIIAVICFKIYADEIYYETIEYSEYISSYENIFYSGVLISGLGAIMDIAIVVSAAVNELIEKNPEIPVKELKKSAWSIVQDITGTMMNVLFFSCIAGTLPIVIFITQNGLFSYAFSHYGSAEIIRALVGCIGIVLAGPISYLVNIILRKGRKS